MTRWTNYAVAALAGAALAAAAALPAAAFGEVDWGRDALGPHAMRLAVPLPQHKPWQAPDMAMPFDVSYIPGPMPVGVAQGGTGLTSGTSGGVLCYTGAATLASSSALTAGGLLKGGGAGACPAVSALNDNGTLVTSTETIDAEGNAYAVELANAGTTGTTLNHLAKTAGAPATAVIAATSDTDGELGIVIGGAGTTGNAQIAISGTAACVFDGATTAGNWVEISSATAGDCKDSGAATRPTGQQTIGRVLSTNASAGTYAVALDLSYLNTSGGGSGTVNSGTQYQGAYYGATGTAVSGSAVYGTNAAGQFVTTGARLVPIRVVTAAGAVTVSAATDYIICVDKTTGAATAVDLPAGVAGLTYVIKDCKGDAATNNITVTPAAGNIDGAATYVIATNRGAINVTYDGTEWDVW